MKKGTRVNEQEDDQTEIRKSSEPHPSRSLEPRTRGYGIGGGIEAPYRKRLKPLDAERESYGPLPHSGYYGAGSGVERFTRGHAGFNSELAWYGPQYGEITSERENEKT